MISSAFLSCRSKNPTESEKHSTDTRLLNFKIAYVGDVDSVLRLPEDMRKGIFDSLINSKTDTVTYGKGTTQISCLTMLSGCGEYRGNIVISNDTLSLKVINTSVIACTEQNCYRLIYQIDNPALEEFHILKP